MDDEAEGTEERWWAGRLTVERRYRVKQARGADFCRALKRTYG